jgi:hypothetical protein
MKQRNISDEPFGIFIKMANFLTLLVLVLQLERVRWHADV